MRILIIQPWISYRGAETVSVQEAYFLQRNGVSTSIAALFIDWKRLPQHGESVSYILPHHGISNLLQKYRLLLLIFGPIVLFLLVIKKRDEFDLLNPHNLPSLWVAAICKILFGKKYIWTVHNVPEKISWKDKKSVFEYIVWLIGSSRFDIWAGKQSDAIIAVSTPVARMVKYRYNKDAKVIYSGIRKVSEDITQLPKEIIRLRKISKFLILQVAALHSQKRQIESLLALKEIHKKEKSAALVFVGEGPDRKILEQKVIELNLTEFVYFAGFIPQESMGAYYKMCDLHLLPSVGESFAASPLEALSFGKLSILTNESGVVEVIKTYSLKCRPYAESIYKQLYFFLQHRKELKKKGRKGAIYIKKLLNWNKFAKDYIKIAQLLLPSAVSPDVYNEAYYTAHYENEHKALKIERETRLKRSLELSKIKPGIKILDLGCGVGELCVQAANSGADVYGIDYSSEGISLANKRKKKFSIQLKKRLHYSVMDAAHLKFPDNFFDRIICIDVFEHIHREPLKKVIQEMTRVIKPNGRIVVETAPNKFFLGPVSYLAKKFLGWEKFESDEYHINIYDYFRLKQTLGKIPGKVNVTVLNDSHQFFSSRLHGVKGMPSWIKGIARIADFLNENAIMEAIILNTPLKIFLAHDLWGTVDVKK